MYLNLGSQVRAARQARGLTQEQLAEAADISVSYLRGIERGKKTPSLGVVASIADSLDVSFGAA